eukprot:6194172-Pleurochrysis_carterae.AAC.3
MFSSNKGVVSRGCIECMRRLKSGHQNVGRAKSGDEREKGTRQPSGQSALPGVPHPATRQKRFFWANSTRLERREARNRRGQAEAA